MTTRGGSRACPPAGRRWRRALAVAAIAAAAACSGTTNAFMVNAYVIVAALTPLPFDWVPDTTLPPARLQ